MDIVKNKNIVISRLIYSIFITIILFYIFSKTSNGKIILIPFLICSLSLLLKNIFILNKKQNYVKYFEKIFVVSFLSFWFGFLIYACYIGLINKNYTMILFSIPFWICGIFLIKKNFFKQKNIYTNSKINLKFNFKIVISCLLVLILFLSGVLMLFFGIRDTYKLNKQTKNYIITNGYYKDYDIYNSDKNGTTYKLIYVYKVNNIEYSITTDYGTNYIPEKNSIRKIKYNQDNPKEAILIGTNGKNVLIFVGAFFTLGSLAFILGALTVLGYFDKFKIDVVGTYIGIVFLIIGIGIIVLQNGSTMSFIETVKSFSLWILIPFMFIIVGIIQVIKCLNLTKKN